MKKSEVQLILNQLQIKPKKSLGQNFLTDKNILDKIINLSEIDEGEVILEIGPGLGVLTKELIKKAKKVYAIEIESAFCTYLKEKFSTYDNFIIINDDILEVEIPSCNKVISNIPYSITGPIIEKVFCVENPPEGILTIEKSLANRIFYKGKYKDFSRISISVNSFLQPTQRFGISPNSFFPTPAIDLSLIKVLPLESINPFLIKTETREFYIKFIAGIMPYKNKNLANAIELYYNKKLRNKLHKDTILKLLYDYKYGNEKLNSYRAEDFIEISKLMYKFN
jgi:16S rRNA (adenine1518-N6/adenine1519-N6)-dimethyltransferase